MVGGGRSWDKGGHAARERGLEADTHGPETKRWPKKIRSKPLIPQINNLYQGKK